MDTPSLLAFALMVVLLAAAVGTTSAASYLRQIAERARVEGRFPPSGVPTLRPVRRVGGKRARRLALLLRLLAGLLMLSGPILLLFGGYIVWTLMVT